MPTQTTAQALIEYRAELRAGGIDHDLANDLVRDAAQTIVLNDGLCTKPLPGSVVAFSGPSEVSEGVGESESPA
ncbi:hypothetical protein PV728_29490 [Streptomyces europaeiscabiei]|uniref:hypothetical protein n=1 Tax=Streptomyces europaeiscabiei TaxID=146819 RepID=UPI0029B01444|nr:hypothetical protein [Streptomyces europaeiscabiei]MDX3634325.1 hypothetical protein [Streptomyces europaeiscabiei]MDX3651827.1 hypothetical protein [Streptomyces europaeiscabiei]